MTCDHVDNNCPIVQGADIKIPLYYKDPKIADNTKEEEVTYEARNLQIATEFFYLFANM